MVLISVIELLKKQNLPLIDVRSPSEFAQGHIPWASNVPLFSDEERAIVGTLYKQDGKDAAVREGLTLISPRMNAIVDQIKIIAPQKQVVVHCWRGGMRSKSIAMLLEFFGFQTFVVEGGYKAFKKYIRDAVASLKNIVLIGGKTGSGKTKILHELKLLKEQVIDLELLAHHRGSTYGAIGLPAQPTQEQFIIDVLVALAQCDPTKIIWIEHEGARLGRVSVPQELWKIMYVAPVVYIEVPLEYRIAVISQEYGVLPTEELIKSTDNLLKLLGGADTKKVVDAIMAHDMHTAISLLLVHYDRAYTHSTERNDHNKFYKIQLVGDTPQEHADQVLAFCRTQNFAIA